MVAMGTLHMRRQLPGVSRSNRCKISADRSGLRLLKRYNEHSGIRSWATATKDNQRPI